MGKFKFLNANEPENIIRLNEHAGFLQVIPQRVGAEINFYFQFNDEEPIMFASGGDVLNISINPEENANVIFNDNGRVFKIFAKRTDD